MRRTLVLLCGTAAIVVAAGCQERHRVWFDGGYSAAATTAKSQNALMMLEFYADWCSWCRRMEKDTFGDIAVRRELRNVVAVRLDVEREGEKLADRYDIESYPTFVFTNADGEEIDRIVGYLPPEEFIAESRRIRAGDTFVGCLNRLSEDPSDREALNRAVAGLLERSDPEGAISKIKAYHGSSAEHDHDTCKQLMFQARAALQTRTYVRAAKLYQRGWDASLIAPDTDGTMHLRALIDGGFGEFEREAQAARLRQARYDDAGELLEMLDIDGSPHGQLWEIGEFAFSNGHYETARNAFERWYENRRGSLDADRLNLAAWRLFLSRQSLDLAVEMARQAWKERQTHYIADTLGRLLYVTGEVDEGIQVQRRAVELVTDEVRAEFYSDGLRRMQAGQPLLDRPDFESYPGEHDLIPTTPNGVVI